MRKESKCNLTNEVVEDLSNKKNYNMKNKWQSKNFLVTNYIKWKFMKLISRQRLAK